MDPKQEKKILLVEDSQDHAFLIKRAISGTQPNLKVDWVKDGEEAVNSVLKEGIIPDLILLDIKMPRMNGFEVLKILKTNGRTKTIPIVILTTSANEKDVSRAYSLGTNCYITKPIEIVEFRTKLGSIPQYWLKTNIMPNQKEKYV